MPKIFLVLFISLQPITEMANMQKRSVFTGAFTGSSFQRISARDAAYEDVLTVFKRRRLFPVFTLLRIITASSPLCL